MRAYRMTDWQRQPEITEVPVPVPGPGEVLVKVAGCGLCHSDLTMAAVPGEIGRALGWRMPFTLGHETAGHVAAAGPDVTGFGEGDAVALVSPSSCGSCWYCLRGLDSSCPHGLTGRGFGRDGGLAEYVRVDSVRGLAKLPSLDPRTAGPLTDAGATSYHAVRRALPRIHPGGVVAVLGAGGLGAFAVQYLRLLTAATVVAVDPNEARLALAGELGAQHTLSGVTDSTAGELRALTDGHGVDAVLDFAGTDATLAAGLASVRAGGTYGLVGAAAGKLDAPWYGALPRDGEVFTFQGSSVADLQDVLFLAESGALRNETTIYPFDRVAEAYAALDEGTVRGRAVVTFDG